MKPLLSAFGFLTVVPIPAKWSGDPSTLGRSIAYFPLVGLLIGLVVAVLDAGLTRLLPVPVASVLVGVALMAVSGGLHIDGLADTADGFFGARRPRARILEIMKDSRSGPMAVAAVVLVVALKLAAIDTLAPELRAGTLVLMPLAGRSAMVVCMALLGYARSEVGTGAAFAARRPWVGVAIGILLLAAIGWSACGARGLAVCGASVATAIVLSAYFQYKIGGWTGDTLGAVCELVEIVPALVVSVNIEGIV
jgi:adenosylcobinamide-GDP ribazoletransferase